MSSAALSRREAAAAFIDANNLIINGGFDIWQWGTALPAAQGSAFLADRWQRTSAGTTQAVSRQAFVLGQTDVPGNPTYFLRSVVASVAGVGNYAILVHTIEGVRTLAGQKATFSFYAKADAPKQITVEFAQNFGTGGSPSAFVTGIAPTKINLTAAWQRFTITVDIPSIAGKVLGTNLNDYLQVTFWMDAGATFASRSGALGQQSGTFDFAQVQLEEGWQASPFKSRRIAEELFLCRRYFQKSYPMDVAPGTTPASAGAVDMYVGAPTTGRLAIFVPFSPPMRAAPTVVCYDGAGTPGMVFRGGNGKAQDLLYGTAQGGFTASTLDSTSTSELFFNWTASAEL